MAIFVTGDTHGSKSTSPYAVDGFMHRFNTTNFPEGKELTKNDYVIICGDFGGIWTTDRKSVQESPSERYALDWLQNKPFTTLFVPGNHENYDRLTGIKDEKLLNSWLFAKMPDDQKKIFKEGYPKMTWNGGTVRVIRPSVLMLETGVFTINNKKIFVYGGAPSHDIQGGILNPADFPTEQEFAKTYQKMYNSGVNFRVKGISWWEQELPDKQSEQNAINALEKVNWTVDFIITHDCAISDRTILGYIGDTERIHMFLQEIKEKMTYKHWFFGHLHDNQNLPGNKEHLIYEQIVQIQ